MRILVCVKQVPSSNEVHLDPVTHTIIRDGRQSIVNPFDLCALEEALRLRERLGGSVTVVSMGIPAAEELLRDLISRGADDGLLLSDRRFAGADTLATSYTLAQGIRALGAFDLILCGRIAVDGDTAQIGPELAQHLGIPHVSGVQTVTDADTRALTCTRQADGVLQELRVTLPALLTVCREGRLVRMPSLDGVRRSQRASVLHMTADDLVRQGADPARFGLNGSPTQVRRTYIPERRGSAQALCGMAEEQADALCALIGEVL